MLNFIVEHVSIKVHWITKDWNENSESSNSVPLCYKDINPNNSSNYIYDVTTIPFLYIFDYLNTKHTNHSVVSYIDTMDCISRHRKHHILL